jgi:hypothetical protein
MTAPRQRDIQTLLDARRHLQAVLLDLAEAARHFAALDGSPLAPLGASGLALCGRLVDAADGWLRDTADACLDAARQTGAALRRHARDKLKRYRAAAGEAGLAAERPVPGSAALGMIAR